MNLFFQSTFWFFSRLWKRWKSPTPAFFKKISKFGGLLTALGSAFVLLGTETGQRLGGIFAFSGAAIVAVAEATCSPKGQETETQKYEELKIEEYKDKRTQKMGMLRKVSFAFLFILFILLFIAET